MATMKMPMAVGSGGGGTYSNSKHGIIPQSNPNTTQTITCTFAPKLVIVAISTQAVYSRLMYLSADGTYDIDIGNNGSESVSLASNSITISGNDVTVTIPSGWGNYCTGSYIIYG